MSNPTKSIGTLQKVSTPCLRCTKDVCGFLVPDGRFVCPNCDSSVVYEHWNQIWVLYEGEVEPAATVDDAKAKPAPAFFQFHLSTAIGLMFLAAVLLYANVTQHVRINYPGNTYLSSGFPMDFKTSGGAGYVINAFSFLWLCFLFWITMEAWTGQTPKCVIVLCTGFFATPVLSLGLGTWFCNCKFIDTPSYLGIGWPYALVIFHNEEGQWIDYVNLDGTNVTYNYAIALAISMGAVFILTALVWSLEYSLRHNSKRPLSGAIQKKNK